MEDASNSDEEKYANESFENETEIDEIPEVTDTEDERENDSAAEIDKDINSNGNNNEFIDSDSGSEVEPQPVTNNSLLTYSRNRITGRTSFVNRDYIRYESSSDDDDDVVISETIAEINTQAMCLEDVVTPSASILRSQIDIELSVKQSISSTKEAQEDIQEAKHKEDHRKEENEHKEMEEENYNYENLAIDSDEDTSDSNEDYDSDENTPANEDSDDYQAVLEQELEAIKSLEMKETNDNVSVEIKISEEDIILTNKMLQPSIYDEKLKESSIIETNEIHYLEKPSENYNITDGVTATETGNDTECDFYEPKVELRITSQTPTSFNSDEYAFHMNFIKKSISNDKLRIRNNNRKSWSFSNERVREIERQNQILLRKILTQKPTYVMKQSKSNHQQFQQIASRLTSAAVNRKKQQRQIDLDNQVLKRKIEAISLRRPLLSSNK